MKISDEAVRAIHEPLRKAIVSYASTYANGTCADSDEAWRAVCDAYAATLTQPAGEWVKVPRVPTPEMVWAGRSAGAAEVGKEFHPDNADPLTAAYTAMISSAPAQPAATAPEGAPIFSVDDALRKCANAFAWVASDSYDGIDDRGRDLIEEAAVAVRWAIATRSQPVAADGWADCVLVAVKRPEDYEGVDAQLVAEDFAQNPGAFAWRVVDGSQP